MQYIYFCNGPISSSRERAYKSHKSALKHGDKVARTGLFKTVEVWAKDQYNAYARFGRPSLPLYTWVNGESVALA